MRRAPYLLVLLLLTAGCQRSANNGGVDSAYLADLPALEANPVSPKEVFPLAPGNYWIMGVNYPGEAKGDVVAREEKVAVTKTITVAGAQGIEVETQREGRAWRREVYAYNAAGDLCLLGFGEGDQLYTVKPPCPILPAAVKEGATCTWTGTFMLKGRPVPAKGFSRVTALDTLPGNTGRYRSYRVESVISVSPSDGSPVVHFPGIRWLAPGTGLMRRMYVDGGKAALAQMVRFNIASKR